MRGWPETERVKSLSTFAARRADREARERQRPRGPLDGLIEIGPHGHVTSDRRRGPVVRRTWHLFERGRRLRAIRHEGGQIEWIESGAQAGPFVQHETFLIARRYRGNQPPAE